ncbi:hypothetical protein EZS27_004647 [termite gut metagenome]|uniref:Peptidase S74 domain-containing protein n=1 Tax=termite gut metagenome TaxID=433724 RepID=A0A5J4SPE7_9ZZZZ
MRINIKKGINDTIIFGFDTNKKNISYHKNELYYIVEEVSETISFYSKNDDVCFLTVLLSNLTVENDPVTRENVNTILSTSLFFSAGNIEDYYTKEETDERLNKKQNLLVQGENIVLTELESGDVEIQAVIPEKPLYIIVETLPEIGEENQIYLVPEVVEETNKFHEWIYVSGEWEDMGTFVDDVDLSDYYTKGEVNTITDEINNEIDTINNLTVNGKGINTSPVLNGSDIKLDNYTLPEGIIEHIDSNDTALTGIEKLDKFLDREIGTRITNEGIINNTLGSLANDIDTINTDIDTVNAYTVNGKTISTNPVLSASDILMDITEKNITGTTVNQAIFELEKEIEDNKGDVDSYTINLKNINTNPLLNGEDIKLSEYTKGTSISPISTGDTVNQGLGKIEYKVDTYKTNIDDYTINSKKISTSPEIFGSDITLSGYVPTITGSTITSADTVNTAISKLFNEIKSEGGDYLPLSGGTLEGTLYGTTISASTISGGTISGTTLRSGTFSASTITAATSMRTPIISATTSAYTPSFSASTITASTSIYSSTITADTSMRTPIISATTSAFTPVLSATTITAATSMRTAILSATTSAYTPVLSATTISGTNIYATNFLGNNGFFSTSSMTPSMVINNSTTGDTVKNFLRFGCNNSSTYDIFVKNTVCGGTYQDFANTLIISKAGSIDLYPRVVFDFQNTSTSGSIVPIISLHRYSTSQPNMIEWDNFTTQAGAKWYAGMMSNGHFDFVYGSRTDAYANGILFTIEASSGNIKAKGNCSAVTFVSTSDVRLKEDIQPLSNRGRLKPVSYKLKENGTDHIGFLAQDIQKLYPEVVPVSNNEDDMLGINYGNLTAVLSVQINELFDKVDDLERDNKTLNIKLNNKIEELNIKNKELNDKFNDRVVELDKENKILHNTINKLNLDNKELLKNVNKLHVQNTEDFDKKFNDLYNKFNDKTNDLIKQNNELKDEIDKLKNNTDKKDSELKELDKKKKDILRIKKRR